MLLTLSNSQTNPHGRRHGSGVVSPDDEAMDLFRRAIIGRDDACWQRLAARYEGHVRAWCADGAYTAPSAVDDLVAQTWEKFWQHYTAEKLAAASDLQSVLAYLRMCARSVVIDAMRHGPAAIPLNEVIAERFGPIAPGIDEGMDLEERGGFWRIVAEHLNDERDRVLIHLRYVCDLRPREVYERRPDLFASVAEVYRVNRLILDRLRRSLNLRDWLAAA